MDYTIPPRPSMPVQDRARRYIAKMPPAISGSGGHDATFAVAVALARGFALPEATALDLLREWNLTHALPPWTEKDLRHKIREAAKSTRPLGYLIKDDIGFDPRPAAHCDSNTARRLRAEKKARCLRARNSSLARKSRAVLLNRWAADEGFFGATSPVPLPLANHQTDWRYFISSIFEPDDVLWMGADPHDSGRPEHVANFRPAAQWTSAVFPPPTDPELASLTIPPSPFGFTTGSTFKAGSFSRQVAAVVRHQYAIVEADKVLDRDPEDDTERALNLAGNFALVRWLQECCGWNLRALIVTGNKSAHAWFDYPGEAALADLRTICEALGIDPHPLCPVQPARLPGTIHPKTGRRARLIFLAPKYTPVLP